MRLTVMVSLASLVLLANPGGGKEAPKPYDLVLSEPRIVFASAEELMQQKMPLLVRDLGVRELNCQDFTVGLVVVWDGKEYRFEQRGGMGSTGPLKIRPKTAWATSLDLSHYDIAKTVLAPGRHTLAVRDAFAKSNILTLFIEKRRK